MTGEALSYRFDDFVLDTANRQLRRGAARVDLNRRYFDALALLVQHHGQLVGKDQFFDVVWGDVVVSDAALTQCIKDIRKQLGDAAAHPRYIETVPRYGYRFIGQVEVAPPEVAVAPARPVEGVDAPERVEDGLSQAPQFAAPWQAAARWGIAGMLGGGVAGILGGLLYGSALAYAPADPGLGTASILLVVLSVNVLVGLAGGLGVSGGMAAVDLARQRRPRWSIPGAAAGGLLVGGLAKLLGVDAFTLFFGTSPVAITGGLEGAVLGAALALGARLGESWRAAPSWGPVAGGGLACAVAGALIPLAGGHLMGSSLERLARSFAGSRLQLDALGRFFGEAHFGPTTQMVTGGIEGFLFGCCVAGAIVLAERSRYGGTPLVSRRHPFPG